MVRGSQKSKISAIPRVWILIAFIIFCVFALVVGIIIGEKSSNPTNNAASTAQKTIPVTAQVEKRSVGSATVIKGKFSEGKKETFTPTISVDRSIVTGKWVDAGQEVFPGTLLATVSDVPIIAMPDTIPFYRTISPGDQGTDIKALQVQLQQWGFSAPSTGKWDKESISAYQEFLEEIEAPVHNIETVDWKHFLLIPASGVKISSISSEGTVLDESHSLITLESGEATAVARADIETANQIKVGDQIEVSNDEKGSSTGRIGSISEFHEDGQYPGKDITVILPEDFVATDKSNVILTIASSAAPGLAVPLSAIRTDHDKEYVLIHESKREVPVHIIKQADGWAAIEPAEGLEEGTSLELPHL